MIKNLVRGLIGFAALFFIYLVSLLLFYYFSIPLPPALIGIFILLVFLIVRRRVPVSINQSARPMLAHMGLFLLPALVSVLLYGDLISDYYLSLITAVVLSTVVSLGITLWFSQAILSNVKTKPQKAGTAEQQNGTNDDAC
jgi:holin-like protein